MWHMLALLDAFFQIVRRRRGPEDLPDSQFLLSVVLAAYMIAQVPVAAILNGWSATALAAILVDTALLASVFWLLLRFTQHMSRYRRTLTALLGSGALLALPQAPLVFFSKVATAAGQAPVGPTVGLLAVLFWSIVVQAHIVSRALSSNFGVGLAVALAYFLLSYQVSGQFAPAAG
jgi:hypothetical protein